MKPLVFAAVAIGLFASNAIAQSGGVAILDIDKVARELGAEEKLRIEMLSMETSLNKELAKAQAQFQKELQGVEESAGENPTEEQQLEIMTKNQELNSKFDQLRENAQQSMDQERIRLIDEFRTKLEPIALLVAKEKGLEIVLTKIAPPVFAYSSSVDITAATMAKAEQAGLKVEIPEVSPRPVAAPAEEAVQKDK